MHPYKLGSFNFLVQSYSCVFSERVCFVGTSSMREVSPLVKKIIEPAKSSTHEQLVRSGVGNEVG
mgnify:CR=1 FL=1